MLGGRNVCCVAWQPYSCCNIKPRKHFIRALLLTYLYFLPQLYSDRWYLDLRIRGDDGFLPVVIDNLAEHMDLYSDLCTFRDYVLDCSETFPCEVFLFDEYFGEGSSRSLYALWLSGQLDIFSFDPDYKTLLERGYPINDWELPMWKELYIHGRVEWYEYDYGLGYLEPEMDWHQDNYWETFDYGEDVTEYVSSETTTGPKV